MRKELTKKEKTAVTLDNYKVYYSDFIVEKAGILAKEYMDDIFDVECLADDLKRLVSIDQRIDNAKTVAEVTKIIKKNFLKEELNGLTISR